jgi:ferredoxin-NADP reductase
MSSDELRAKYNQAYRMIHAERKMREFVFRNDTDKLNAKLAEIDRLLYIVTEFKDELKRRIADEEYSQPRLLDTPQKAGYA